MSESLEFWMQQIDRYLEDGISVIPIADKKMIYKGRPCEVKTPLGPWAQFQKRRRSKEELLRARVDSQSSGVAIVCGKISGNLEVIDVDVKYKPGIDAILFEDLEFLYPDLHKKLRIHKTPSSGFHFIYRVSGGVVPGSFKLAGRPLSKGEIDAQIAKGIKRPNKEVTFLETRGEGGYIAAPPSIRYTVHRDLPIPTITWEERCSLIALCQSYNEIIKEEKPYKLTKKENYYYDQSPFEHFNNICDPVALMNEFGWKEFTHNSRYIHFTRQGKESGVSASFNIEKRFFYVFTTSTELEANRPYSPATLLAELKFDGDKQKTHAYLVEKGYGKVKKSIEEKIVKRTAMCSGKLPANFSEDAKQQLHVVQGQLKERYPHGIFWYQDDDKKVGISRELVYKVAKALGFFLYKEKLVFIEGYLVKKVDRRFMYDSLKKYINEEDEEYRIKICNIYESFLQRSGNFTIERLSVIAQDEFVRDDKRTAFKFYLNGWLKITAEGYKLHSYGTIPGLIWGDQIQQRDFVIGSGGFYIDFLNKAIEFEKHKEHFQKIIGWLAHQYKDDTTAYIIALTEQCQDPKQGGGSGKNLFCNLFKWTTSYTSINGAQVRYDDTFLQSWNEEHLFCISDPKKDFDWPFLKNLADDSANVKKLYQNVRTIKTQDLPKMLVATNFSFEITDGGLDRRIIGIEFTDFFTKCGGIDRHYGKYFPHEWSVVDWAGYDTLIAQSIQVFLASGLKLTKLDLTEGGWTKQFDQMHGQLTRQFIEQHMDVWLKIGFVANDAFKKEYEMFCNENNVYPPYRKSSARLNSALEAWCQHKKVAFESDVSKKDQFNSTFKARTFCDEELPF